MQRMLHGWSKEESDRETETSEEEKQRREEGNTRYLPEVLIYSREMREDDTETENVESRVKSGLWGTSEQCHRATFAGTRSPGWKATSQGRRGKPGVRGQREQGEKQAGRGAGGPVGSTCALREEAYWGRHTPSRKGGPARRTD